MMRLKDIGEFGLIDKIAQGCVVDTQSVEKAIGDDCAVFRTEADNLVLVTTDLLIEGVHFLRKDHDGFTLGYKSLAVNLSDIAAMGGMASQAFVSLGIPDDCTIEYLDDFYQGLKDIATKYGVNILGGDTSRSLRDMVINISVVGKAQKGQLLYRDGAKPGDIICVTGYLGDSRAGLHMLLNKVSIPKNLEKLIQAHLIPEPFLWQGQFLAATGGVHSAIDVSDGFCSDLNHILVQSHVGAEIFVDNLPISNALKQFGDRFDIDPVKLALDGGEDYVLICTIAPEVFDKISEVYLTRFEKPLYRVGQISAQPGIELHFADHTQVYEPAGWNHFK